MTRKVLCCKVHNGAGLLLENVTEIKFKPEKDVIEFISYDWNEHGENTEKSSYWRGLTSSDTKKHIFSINRDGMYETFDVAHVSFYISEYEFDEEEHDYYKLEQVNMFDLNVYEKKWKPFYALSHKFWRNEINARQELINFYNHLAQKDYKNAEYVIKALSLHMYEDLDRTKKAEEVNK